MRNLYSLFVLGAFLFAACSDNASISGSTNVPNMENKLVPKSPVLCSVMGVTDSLEAVEKGCIWSPEMWSRTSGYRVHTGFDNGTNTSGIWTWHVEQGGDGNVRFEWPGVATDEYDSMALADVIDKCGGSLCGKVVYEPNEVKVDSATADSESYGSAYVEFYFAGKDSLGNIGEVDARAMQGICVEHSGDIFIELIPSDSIANLNKISTFGFPTNSLDSENLLSKSTKTCDIWEGFVIDTNDPEWFEIGLVPMEDVLAHLKGIRIIFEENTDFNIISIDWYNLNNVPMTGYHPFDETCEPVYVNLGYCDCEFTTDDLAVAAALSFSVSRFAQKKIEVESDSIPLSNLSKECLISTLDSLSILHRIKQTALGSGPAVPCDNPRPQFFACANGTSSITTEYWEKFLEYQNKKVKPLEEKMIADADSLFAHCISLNN
ncbi:hypothetical protein [Fibrobacter sp.]|uniref:hypothetical protein n=1 Tax=Fibrobacter sp. TaxID=35828 RepID=UPI00386E3B63